MTKQEKQAREILKKQSMQQLLEQWELTAAINEEHIPIVRGWLMDEFESRKPVEFEKWLDSENCDDFELKDTCCKNVSV